MIEFWQCVALDGELSGYVIDYFLGLISSSCLYEVSENSNGNQNMATHQPFAIFCALKEIVSGKEIQTVRFTNIVIHLFNLNNRFSFHRSLHIAFLNCFHYFWHRLQSTQILRHRHPNKNRHQPQNHRLPAAINQNSVLCRTKSLPK